MTTLTYFIKKAGKAYSVPFDDYSADVRDSIIQAGLGRILNDLVAGTKTESDSRDAVSKKLTAWANGEVRTSTTRTSDPVAKRALELASNAIKGSKGFIAWMQTNGLKLSSKEAIAKANELAKGLTSVEGNKYTAQAAIDVAAAQALGDDELDIEI